MYVKIPHGAICMSVIFIQINIKLIMLVNNIHFDKS